VKEIKSLLSAQKLMAKQIQELKSRKVKVTKYVDSQNPAFYLKLDNEELVIMPNIQSSPPIGFKAIINIYYSEEDMEQIFIT